MTIFVKVINQYGTDNQKSLLGDAHTDWNDEVYRTRFRYRQQPQPRR